MVVRGNRIAAVGEWPDISRSVRSRNAVVDLGDSILLPGLVNAHCHLDYTSMAGCLRPMDVFTDWLKLITEIKSGWDYADYADSWRSGAQMLLRTGCTTVADIEALPDLLPAMWDTTPIRVFSFLEMIGITARRSPDIVISEVRAKLQQLGPKKSLLGISPHAPYSTVPGLLNKSAALAKRRNLRLCMHLAESKLEYDMFVGRRGEMFSWIRKSGRDMSDCGRGTPVQHAWRCGILNERLLAVHVNYLGRGDAEALSRASAHVVHCPRSHRYFGHASFPLQKLKKAGVNACLGTDSLASVLKKRNETVELSMFQEMQAFLKSNSQLPPVTALEMSTTAGAKALGLSGRIGELASGALADLIAVPSEGAGDVTEAAVHHRGDVTCAMINGVWAVPPPGLAISGDASAGRSKNRNDPR